MNIAILFRVYDRVEDLEKNLHIIRDTWSHHKYDLYVVSNGKNKGYSLTEDIFSLSDNVVELEENAGHLKGNSQLLIEGWKKINFHKYEYVIILEADSWIYGDYIVNKYVEILREKKAVWASARWYDRFLSLATDFAIIDSSFLANNPSVFDFGLYPECYVASYIHHCNQNYVWIKENQNVQIAGYMKKLPFAPQGRFYCFPKSKMVTHHIEHYSSGMITKMQHFNIVAGVRYFNVDTSFVFLKNLYMRFIHILDSLCVRRSWFSKRVYRVLDEDARYKEISFKI